MSNENKPLVVVFCTHTNRAIAEMPADQVHEYYRAVGLAVEEDNAVVQTMPPALALDMK